MSIYAIGDLHLSFSPGLSKPMDIYGGNWIDHTAKLKRNWLETINADDTVILAGDISWALKLSEAIYDLEWIDQLPGHKVIFKGNHDLWWSGMQKMNSMFESITFVQNTAFAAEGYYICGSRGWSCPGSDEFKEQDERIYKRELLRLDMSFEEAVDAKKIIGVLHFPPSKDNVSGSGFTQSFEKIGAETVVYGHLHGVESYKNGLQGNFNGVFYRLVSFDYINGQPVLIKE